MQSALKALGENIKNQQSTAEFITPLNSIAVYYAHQQDQLKGYEKDPNKLAANLKIIDGWIKEVKTLIQVLQS